MMRNASALLTLVLGLAASPVSAQVLQPVLAPDVAVRPFVLFSEQRFAASETFKATLNGAVQPFVGAGAQVALANGFFVEAAFSRFSKSGQRVFQDDGETFEVGIPLKVTIMPIEISGGYRFGAEWSSTRVIPYVAAGLASYKYTETSGFEVAGDKVSERGSGFLVLGGAEFRVHPWVSASADVQYTRVGGVFGEGGLSQQLEEDDLGGVAVRFRVIIGR